MGKSKTTNAITESVTKIDKTLAERIRVDALDLNKVVRILYEEGKNYEGRQVKKFAFEFAPLTGEERKVGKYEPGYALELPAAGSIGGASPMCRFGFQSANGDIGLDNEQVEIAKEFATSGSRYSDLYYSNSYPLEVLGKSLTALARDMARDLQKSEISKTFNSIKNLHAILALAFATELAAELRIKGLMRP